MLDDAILIGPCVGEFGWELLRLAPHAMWKKKNGYKNKVKMIVLTRPDRFDLYGRYADILVPLKIKGDFTKYKGNGFGLRGFPDKYYDKITKQFYDQYSKRFNIIDHIFPTITGREFLNKNMYHKREMITNFKPRDENQELIDGFIPNDKPSIVLSPRFREGFKRNWKNWYKLYDLIDDSDLMDTYNFILAGKHPEYLPDAKKRFYDINDIKFKDNSSLVGLTISVIKQSILTIGSQSAIPNLSLMVGTPVLEWGHEKKQHTITYNYNNTKITFLDDATYSLSEKVIFDKIKELVKHG